MTRDAWISSHPYLRPFADFQAVVDAAAAETPIPSARIPDWDAYADDFHAGVPLLRSVRAGVDVSDAESGASSLVDRLAARELPGTLAEQCRAHEAGVMRYLGSIVLGRYLRPVVDAFARWRDEDRWLRSYCPTCGAPPAMAQLIGIDPGRLRLLSCGCCGTRWRYRRTGCPFCDDQDEHRLAIVAVEGEGGLRIDYCETCRGYLKTYNGEGSEGVLLADWTSLHLDFIARNRGLKRLAASVYTL